MSKLFKISLIFIAIITLFAGFSLANTTNLYNDVLTETTSETSSEDESLSAENSEPESSSTPYDTSLYTSNQNARVSTVSSIPEANLGLNNVLCIILIAIGILIILLAIAILIRLSK